VISTTRRRRDNWALPGGLERVPAFSVIELDPPAVDRVDLLAEA